MREDFIETENDLKKFGILRICEDTYMKPNNRLFVKSPVGVDKTPSLRLYPKTDSFYDYSTNTGGGIIRFFAYVKGVDNWTALKELRVLYGLSGISMQDKKNIRQRIMQQEKEREALRRAEYEHKKQQVKQIDRLKTQVCLYGRLLTSKHLPPFCEIRRWCVDRKLLVEHRLDTLCGLCE